MCFRTCLASQELSRTGQGFEDHALFELIANAPDHPGLIR